MIDIVDIKQAIKNGEILVRVTDDIIYLQNDIEEVVEIGRVSSDPIPGGKTSAMKRHKGKTEPRPVIYSGDGYADGYMVYDYAECPNCEREFEYGRDEWDMPYCCACGQALKWEAEE